MKINYLELYHLLDKNKLDIFEYDIVLLDVQLLILGNTHRNKELACQKQAKLVDRVPLLLTNFNSNLIVNLNLYHEDKQNFSAEDLHLVTVHHQHPVEYLLA